MPSPAGVDGAAAIRKQKLGTTPLQGSGTGARPGRARRVTLRSTRRFRFGSEELPDGDAPLPAGALIDGRYRVVGLLGEGGMGRVYAAEHTVLARQVAVKLLRRDAARSPEHMGRFRQEALAASQIGAPQIVEVLDFVTARPDEPHAPTYMVMEMLEGEPLEAWMDEDHGLDEAFAILAQLCDGLAAAHRAGVIHRDVKPANVFVCATQAGAAPQVKILDFGVAKVAGEERGFETQQGSVLGTPYYVAPERILGEQLRPAADLYSVGVMLYELLTGDVPFTGESFVEILAQHVHKAVLDPRQAAPGRAIPGAAADLCMRLLDKEVGRRPADAQTVAGELRAMLVVPELRSALAALRVHEGAGAAAPSAQLRSAQTLPVLEPMHARETLPPRESVPMRFAPTDRPRAQIDAVGVVEAATAVEPEPRRLRGVVIAVLLAGLVGGAVALFAAQRGEPAVVPAPSAPAPEARSPEAAAPGADAGAPAAAEIPGAEGEAAGATTGQLEPVGEGEA
ncbi:serine/threonine-protein kinase, partial [Plesiocystis pacifica]|uniref:serine/threonine-protein kinase n=1 Tax=Plesiocystis pacifica TaxID=191768 RepID=UPI0018DE6CEE